MLILLLSTLCGLAIGGVVWYRSRTLTPAAMLKRLPADDAVVVYVDFAALRAGGILQMLDGAKVGEDPEYRTFVAKTAFDYKQDLDAAMLAMAPTGNYILAKGRFDWKSLAQYVRSQNGNCNNSFCRMAGSAPERRISFFPLQSGLMALAVSGDEAAALRLNTEDPRPDRQMPGAPLWLSIPPSIVRSRNALPDGAQMFARSLEKAQAVTLSVAPQGGDFAARLNVRCANDADAAAIAEQLTKSTSLLNEMIRRENQRPNPDDFSGFLTSGAFKHDGTRVEGYWPISRTLLSNLLGGA
jgi:hypothetical protein